MLFMYSLSTIIDIICPSAYMKSNSFLRLQGTCNTKGSALFCFANNLYI